MNARGVFPVYAVAVRSQPTRAKVDSATASVQISGR